MPKLNSPGCGCCEPPCQESLCGDGTTEDIREIEWQITLPDTLVWWWYFFEPDGTHTWQQIVGTGFSNFNGTYIVTRTLYPCGWLFPDDDEYDIDYVIYRHEFDGVPIPGTGFAQCPVGSYTTAETLTIPTKATPQISLWTTYPWLYVSNVSGLFEFLKPTFNAWQQGDNMRGPCESSSLTYNTFSQRIGISTWTMQDFVDQFGNCNGLFVNYQGTATFTPTLA